MKFVPVDTGRLEAVAIDVVPKMRDGAQQIDKEGTPIWSVRVMARWLDTSEKPEVIEVAIPSRTDLGAVLTPFQPVELQGFKTFPWSMEGRSGLAFSADGARTARPKTNGSKPQPEAVSA